MSSYFNPPQELPQVARKLEGENYDQLVAQLQSGEKLFGHYDRGRFQNAVHLYSESEFEEFEWQVRQGIIWRLGFYAMPQEVFEARVH